MSIEVKKKKGIFTAQLMDEEGDVFEVDFLNDDCATINFSEMTHVTLSESNLYELIDLIEEAKLYYKKTIK